MNQPAQAVLALPTHTTYRIGELFSGAGGMALGAHAAKIRGHGFDHVWINDIDKDSCLTFDRNLPIDKDGVYCCRVEELDFDKLSPIDGLVFGFPCNDFSIIGERQGLSGQYGGLYRWGVKAIEALRPSFFVAENVRGMGSSGKSKDFQIILSALRKVGYHVFPHTYHFEDYGVPQARHRIIVVGFRISLGITDFKHPEPTHKDKPVTCREALANISPDVPNNERAKQSARVEERLKHIKPGENAFTASLPEHLKLDMKSGALISQIYRRLKPDRPSYTVTGSGGGGTHVYHWSEPRALTNRERARLQSFPDSFAFVGGRESIRKQIGMAVPPRGSRIIFEAVLQTLMDNHVAGLCS